MGWRVEMPIQKNNNNNTKIDDPLLIIPGKNHIPFPT